MHQFLDSRAPKQAEVVSTRTARNMKETVLQGMQAINDIYSNLIFSPEEEHNVKVKVIAPMNEEGKVKLERKLVHHHLRLPNVDE